MWCHRPGLPRDGRRRWQGVSRSSRTVLDPDRTCFAVSPEFEVSSPAGSRGKGPRSEFGSGGGVFVLGTRHFVCGPNYIPCPWGLFSRGTLGTRVSWVQYHPVPVRSGPLRVFPSRCEFQVPFRCTSASGRRV